MASTRRFKNGRWVDVPDRPNDVLANIRRNNGGYLISEISAASAPGSTAVITPHEHRDGNKIRDKNGKVIHILGKNPEADRKWIGGTDEKGNRVKGILETLPKGQSIGSFGSAGDGVTRGPNGSPLPGSQGSSFMPYDKRFPGTQNWLKETFGKDAAKGLRDAIKGLGAGATATITGKGVSGVEVSKWDSPMAVDPGTARPGGTVWDAIRAGIHNHATQWAIGQAGRDNPAFGQGVDLADKNDVKAKTGLFNELVAVKKGELAGQFVDNLTQSIRENVEKNWKPTAPTAAQTAEADARAKVGTGATLEERKGNLDAWNAARQAAHAEDAKRHEQSMKEMNDTEKWMRDIAKQYGLKDPTQGAAKGGRARDSLDSLVADPGRYGPAKRMSGEKELTADKGGRTGGRGDEPLNSLLLSFDDGNQLDNLINEMEA